MERMLPPSNSPRRQKGYATFEEHTKTAATPTTHSSASRLSRLLFSYAYPVLELGSRTKCQIDINDLWQVDSAYRTSPVYATYKCVYLQYDHCLIKSLFATFGWEFFCCGCGSAVVEACAIFAPVVLHQVITIFSEPIIRMDDLLLWVGAFLISRMINGFAYTHTQFHLQLALMRCTASLKALLFEKTLRRRHVMQGHSHRQPIDVSNLFTADMDSIMWAGSHLHAVWIMPLQICIVMYLLYGILDFAAFAGVAVIFISMGLNYLAAKAYNKAFQSIMTFKDARMAAVKEVFGAIQMVKLNAWEDFMEAKLRGLRVQEAHAIATYLYLNGLSIFLFWSAPLCVSVASFAVYALVLEKELTAAKVFTSMVLFNAIREPLSQFPEALQALLQARTALRRMSQYLNTKEIPRKDRVDFHDTEHYADDVAISVEDATFDNAWDFQVHPKESESEGLLAGSSLRDSPVLRGVSLTIHKGDFVVVHGAVGTGKSSLCAALLSELPPTQGKVFIRSPSIAYYSQQPWIQNMTIRDNILFGLPYDRTKYDRVLDACGLVKDVAMFPAGDNTEIGQKGINLSGGQKARVALARACYCDADVYILDTPLAAVDAMVQAEIFNKCLCGLLEKKTVILVTHLNQIIESKAANVKILVENGQAKVTYGDRKKSRREYANLHAEEEATQVQTDKEVIDDGGVTDLTSGTLVEEEEREDGRVSNDVFRAYVDALGGPKILVLSIFVIVAWQIFQVGSDIWLSQWTASGETTISVVLFNLTVYACLGLAASVFLLLRSLVMAYTGVQAAHTLFTRMTHSLLHAPLRFFDTNPIGRVLNRYAEDLSTVDFRVPFALFRFLVATFVNVFQVLAAVYVIKWVGLCILPLGWLYWQVGLFYLATFRSVTRLTKTTRSPMLSHLSATQEGVSVLRAFGQPFVDRAIQEHHKRNDTFHRAWYAQTVVNQWFAVRVQMIGFWIVGVIVGTLVVLHESMSPGFVGLAFMYAVSIDIRLSWWLQSWSSLEMAMVSTERIIMYVDIPAEGHVNDRLVVANGTTTGGAQWPQRGAIEFDEVKFAYKPGSDLVLKGLSFQVNHNEKIGIVGRTGAGKSSLTMALFRINELVSGRIVLDGVDISTVHLQTLRSRMSIIPQVPVLFKGSMRAYMDPFEEYSDAEIWMAFDKMGMKQMISDLDGKLQHELSENGENFSVGERQMLCLARALLRKSRVIIMDEATASIDVATEKKLQEMITREFVDATVLTIAHRLATVLESDRILVLSDGRVAEFDTPRQLARMKGGVFRGLAKEGGYLPQLLG